MTLTSSCVTVQVAAKGKKRTERNKGLYLYMTYQVYGSVSMPCRFSTATPVSYTHLTLPTKRIV